MLFRSLKMRGFAVDRQSLELAMRGYEQRAAWGFIGATRFHTYQAIFDDVRPPNAVRSEEHTSELQSPCNLVCRLLLEKKKKLNLIHYHTGNAYAIDPNTSPNVTYAVIVSQLNNSSLGHVDGNTDPALDHVSHTRLT